MQKGISIIICCYNSGWIIRRTLEGIKNLEIPYGLSWEVLLVDNNCQDDTVAIANLVMKDSNIDFSVVVENKPGLANARRKGIDTIKYDIVLYCDDDNILCPNYVSTMYSIMVSDEKIGAAGGKGIAEFSVEPEDKPRNNPCNYAVGSQIDGRKDWLFGAGVTLRTWLVREVYHNQKCYLMGRKGNVLLSGDDSELVMSIVNRGYRINPTDEVYYTHVLKANRLTNEYFERLYKGLITPLPVFEAMRAAMYGTGFRNIEYKYRKALQNYIKFTLIWWRPWSKEQRDYSLRILRPINYWGILTLYRIYREWKKVHEDWNK